jgi:hypothetical protein
MLLGERLRTNMLQVEVFDTAYLQQKRSITPGDRLVAYQVKPRDSVASETTYHCRSGIFCVEYSFECAPLPF